MSDEFPIVDDSEFTAMLNSRASGRVADPVRATRAYVSGQRAGYVL
jgi:hypothetical protein